MKKSLLAVVATILSLALAACGGGGESAPAAPVVGSYAVGGTVTGLSGTGLVLQNNNGDDLAISSNGTFTFATSLASGATYSVIVKAQPTCPSRVCTVTNGSGTLASGNVSGVSVACAPEKIMFFTSNWGDASIKITDDIASLPSGTITPRVVSGPTATIVKPQNDSISVDRARKLIYMTDYKEFIKIYNNADTISGAVAPARIVTVTGAYLKAIAVDSEHDRLYVADANTNKILVFNNASTINGTLSADAMLTSSGGSIYGLHFDEKNDRLYATVASSGNNINVFNNASSLSTGATPGRSASISSHKVALNGISVDACSDRMYLASNQTSTAGNNIFVFNNASTLTGTLDADIDSAATIAFPTALFLLVDSNDRLYAVSDSAKQVKIYDDASLMSGPVSVTPKWIGGAIFSGYGLDYLGY